MKMKISNMNMNGVICMQEKCGKHVYILFLLFCGQWNNSNFFPSLRLVWFACGYS
mgnify:CR=1 FL=1